MEGKRKPEKLSPTEAVKKARWIITNGFTRISHHAKERFKERNVMGPDLSFAIDTMECRCVATAYSEQHNSWKYTLSSVDPNGDPLSVVVGIDARNSRMIVITVF